MYSYQYILSDFRELFIEGSISRFGYGIFYYHEVREYLERVKLICVKRFHVFEVCPADHYEGEGCKMCKYEEEYIKKVTIKHNGEFCYSFVAMMDKTSPIDIWCYDHGIFRMTPRDHLNGKICPKCSPKSNKTEAKLEKYLNEIQCIENIEREYKPEWCSTVYSTILSSGDKSNGKYQYRYDFLVKFSDGQKLIIELDGPQHFKDSERFGTKAIFVQLRDKYKEMMARKNGLKVIRCKQEDVWNDKNDWEGKLWTKIIRFMEN